MHNPRLDQERLTLLHASVADAHRAVERSADVVEETQHILDWLRWRDSPRLGLRPPPER